MAHRGDLSAAHRGYAYQDLTAAIALAELVASSEGSITVERKGIRGDRFDDLVVCGRGGEVRRQIKWSSQGARTFELRDFTAADSNIRIDDLVLSFMQTQAGSPQHECRVCVAWDSPSDPALCAALRESEDPATVPGASSRRFRLLADKVWPEDLEPVWAPLRNPAIDRQHFLSFADHFVLETETPKFSANLSVPGELERLLIRFLVDRIGIGAYPNERRSPEDVAARLIALATWARTERATLRSEEVARNIDLRIDYGRVPQRFPIDADHAVDREGFRRQLRRAIDESSIVVVVGPPGSGKSWELSVLADELQQGGVTVARHYCYLEPGDPDVERRITTNALLGNLVAELLAADPELSCAKQRAYAATLDELELLLHAAADKYAPTPVVLIVDGVDHISRVLSESRGVAADETDIVEELAALSLPAGIRLVLGSQPGIHLEPLHAISREVAIPTWGEAEVWALAERFEVPRQIAGLGDADSVRTSLFERTEGNPLYATFLIRGLVGQIAQGAVAPTEWLRALPPLNGNIANYYAHLYSGATSDARIVAEVLGVIDFAVTEAELGDIIGPQVARHLPAVIGRLQPILTRVTGQGGLRVFHESFRRFIVEKLKMEGLSVDVPLARVIEWLERLGFAQNARAYRFLLPALRRAGRTDELLAHVRADFVSLGVQWGHPRDAINRNLLLATEVAAAQQNWAALVRCSELYRALHTCFEEHLFDQLPYWRVFLSVSGPETTADRLIFDGHPTMDRHLGLVLCSLVDDAGAVAPWDEYLALPPQQFTDRGDRVDITWVGQVVAALLHGRLRREHEGTLEWVRRELLSRSELESAVLVPLCERLVSSAPLAFLDAVLEDGSVACNYRATLLLARARRHRSDRDFEKAATDAQSALHLAPTLEVAEAAIELGAKEWPRRLSLPNPEDIDIGLEGDRYHVEEGSVAAWVSAVRMLAYVCPDRLVRALTRIEGRGWYRSWLRYVVAISKAEVLVRSDAAAASVLAASAFRELMSDTHPFIGQPRAVDLLMLRSTIWNTLARGLAVLSNDADRCTALCALAVAAEGTAAHLFGSPAGPVTRDALIELLIPYANSRPELADKITAAVETQVRAAEQSGEYFATHADIEFAAVRTFTGIGDRERALAHWRRASVYLTAYGSRKDATLYQLIEALPALEDEARLNAIEKLGPLANAVINHTDGKGTKELPNACARELAAVAPAAALGLAARSQVADGGAWGWRIEEAVSDSIEVCHGCADSRLVTLAYSTLRFDVDHDPDALPEVSRRLASIEALASVDKPAADLALRRLAARVEGDHRHDLCAAWPPIADVARRLGVTLTEPGSKTGPEGQVSDPESEPVRYGAAQHQTVREAASPPVLPPTDATPLQLMAWVRDALHPRVSGGVRVPTDAIVNRVGFACIQLAERQREDVAARLLRFLSRQLPTYEREGAGPLVDLGLGFERYGLPHLAAVAFALAFTRSRGGGGWDSFGGDEHAIWLSRALNLDRQEARRTLASEVVLLVQHGYVMGVTPGVIKRVASWGDAITVASCWKEAYEVVRHRLPTRCSKSTTLLPFRRSEIELWNVDEGLIGLIIARVSHPELDRKRSALLAFASAIKARPDAVMAPLRRLLSVDGAPTSNLLLLQVLLLAEESPYPISRGLRSSLELLGRSDVYGERSIAKMLLARAGLAELSVVGPDSPMFDRHASRRHAEMALSLDWGERIEALSSLWPDFQDVLCRRFEQLHFDSQASQERWRNRYDYASRRESKPEFWTPILGWERELFEVALHETLNGVRPYLWRKGLSTIGLDEALLAQVHPNLQLHIAMEASRSVRPALGRPAKTQDGVGAVPVLCADEFTGWRRLGWYERELVFNDDRMRWGNPVEIVHLGGGVVAMAPGDRVDGTPFGRCNPSVWFLDSDTGRDVSRTVYLDGFRGPLVGAARVTDLLADRLVLVAPPVFADRYGLRTGIWPGPLKWCDESGEPAIVFRMWRMRSIEMGNEEPSVLEGCDLVVRADLFGRIERDAGNPLLFVTSMWREPVTPTRHGEQSAGATMPERSPVAE